MIVLLDNYDSFTYNLYQYLCELGAEIEVVRNDQATVEDIAAMGPQKIVVSPGPRTPKDAGISVHCIGVGRGRIIGGLFGGQQVLKPEFESLKTIAQITDGQFHEATSGEELGEVYAVIDELEKVELGVLFLPTLVVHWGQIASVFFPQKQTNRLVGIWLDQT